MYSGDTIFFPGVMLKLHFPSSGTWPGIEKAHSHWYVLEETPQSFPWPGSTHMRVTVLEREHALIQDSLWQNEICPAAIVCFMYFGSIKFV